MMIGVRRFLKSHKHSEFLEAESTLDTLEDSVQVREESCLIILQSRLLQRVTCFLFADRNGLLLSRDAHFLQPLYSFSSSPSPSNIFHLLKTVNILRSETTSTKGGKVGYM